MYISDAMFDGLTEEGQRAIWKKHSAELMQSRGGAHKRFRQMYPPQSFPAFYVNPERMAGHLKKSGKGKRNVRARTSYSSDEKRKMLQSVDLKEVKVAELKEEMKALKTQCAAAGPIVAALLRNKKLRPLIPKEMEPELEAFGVVY